MSTPTNRPTLVTEPPPFNLPPDHKGALDDLDDELPWNELQEDAPAWLISVLFHALIVILLGLMSVGVDQHMMDPLELDVLSTYSPVRVEDSLDSAANEVEPEQLVEEFKVLPAMTATAEILGDPVSLTGVVADVNSDWQEMVASENGTQSSTGRGSSTGRHGDESGIGTVIDRTSFFGLAGEGGKFVYVLDRSDSMNAVLMQYSEGTIVGTIVPLEAAKTELKRSLSTLSDSSQFQIVFYNHAVEFFGAGEEDSKMYQATPQNKKLAFNYINRTPGLGSTDHRIALDAGVAFEPDVIFLLTDAQPHNDLSPDVVMRVIKYCKRYHIQINVVHFSDTPRPDSTMIWMAEGTGGKHVFLDLTSFVNSVNATDLIRAF